MSEALQDDARSKLAIAPHKVQETTCCIVGGGPAGAFLALLLARQGIDVTLLEAHTDFDRDFRGDTIHLAVLEILDELGLTEALLQLPYRKAYGIQLHAGKRTISVGDFQRLGSRYQYQVLMPQVHFLEFLTSEARRYPNFHLKMGARVEQLLKKDGVVGGVIYRSKDGMVEVRAALTVGADGRFSRTRRLAGLEPTRLTPRIDFLWFNLPRYANDPIGEAIELYQGEGIFMPLLDRGDYWQVGCVINKGTYQGVRAAGLDTLQQSVAACIPWFAERVGQLTSWKQISLVSVESCRLTRWYLPGLLFIGDAAHTMSPIAGVGINLAIQDAVAAANRLIEPLKQHHIRVADLAAVQRDREWRTRIVQAGSSFLQRRLAASFSNDSTPFDLPPIARLMLHMPVIGNFPNRLIAYGVWRERLRHRQAYISPQVD